jgi:hypothetical protein
MKGFLGKPPSPSREPGLVTRSKIAGVIDRLASDRSRVGPADVDHVIMTAVVVRLTLGSRRLTRAADRQTDGQEVLRPLDSLRVIEL